MPVDLFAPQSPPADLQPVEFDFGAAAQAAEALRSAAATVDRAAQSRASDAHPAETAWAGGQHDVFVSTESTLSGEASHLVTAMRAQAAKLHHAAARAHAENARRAQARVDWQHDLNAARDRFRAAQAAAAKKG